MGCRGVGVSGFRGLGFGIWGLGVSGFGVQEVGGLGSPETKEVWGRPKTLVRRHQCEGAGLRDLGPRVSGLGLGGEGVEGFRIQGFTV